MVSLCRPITEDFVSYDKYLGSEKGIIRDLLNSDLSQISVATEKLGQREEDIDYSKYIKLNSASPRELESCLKVLMYINRTDCTKYLDAVVRSLWVLSDKQLSEMINWLLPRYSNYPPKYTVDYHSIRRAFMLRGRKLNKDILVQMNDIFADFSSELCRFMDLDIGGLFQLSESEGKFYITALEKRSTINSSGYSSRVIFAMTREGECLFCRPINDRQVLSRRVKSFCNQLLFILYSLGELPFELDNLYFYPLDRMNPTVTRFEYIYGFMRESLRDGLDMLLV